MAQRPIRWAIGTAAVAIYMAVTYATDLAGLMTRDEGPGVKSVTAAAAPPPAKPAGRPVLAVAADSRGHYVVHPTIDNFRVKMLVDTGASLVALTERDAAALGIRPSSSEYRMSLRTANGVVMGARVNLREVRLESIVIRNVEAVVLPDRALSMSLLGTSFLSKLQGYEVQTGRMLLKG